MNFKLGTLLPSVLLGVFFLAVVSSGDARAQTPAGENPLLIRPIIAVLDVQRILRDAKAMQSIRDQVAGLRERFTNERRERERVLQEANQELVRKRSILSQEAFAEERQKFEQQVAEVQQYFQSQGKDADKGSAQAITQVQTQLSEIVKEIATERQFLMVFRRASLVFVPQPLDITSDVLARLDERLPSVDVKLPAKQ